MREKVTGHDAGGGVQTRLIPTFGHWSKLEGGGSPHADNLESLAPFKGLANPAVRPAYRMQIRGCPKQGFERLGGRLGAGGGCCLTRLNYEHHFVLNMLAAV